VTASCPPCGGTSMLQARGVACCLSCCLLCSAAPS
jgi:hypothetical protein